MSIATCFKARQIAPAVGNLQTSVSAFSSLQQPVKPELHCHHTSSYEIHGQESGRLAPKAVFSVSPPLQGATFIRLQTSSPPRRHGIRTHPGSWYDRMARNFQKMPCSRPRTLHRTTVVIAILHKLTKKHHLHKGQVSRCCSKEQSVINIRYSDQNHTACQVCPLDIRKLSRCVRLRQKHQPRDVIALSTASSSGWRNAHGQLPTITFRLQTPQHSPSTPASRLHNLQDRRHLAF